MKEKGGDMIDFSDDGPLGQQPERAERLRIIGLGHAGIGALDQIVMYGMDRYDLVVADTDEQTLEGSVVKQRLLLGEKITRGMGCAGDHELGAEVATASEEELREATASCDFLILTLNFGGATAGMIAPQLIKEAAKQNVKTLVIGTMPFTFESRRRQAHAARTVAQLRRCADAVMVFSNDRFTNSSQEGGNIRQGFHLINQLTARSIESLAQVVSKRGLIQLSFADVRSLYGCLANTTLTENCWAGWAEIDDAKNLRGLIDDLLDSPLLGEEAWKQADHAIVSLSGGSEMSLIQVQKALNELQSRLPANFPMAASATIEENCQDKLRMSLLLARTKVPQDAGAAVSPDDSEVFVHDTVPLPDLALIQNELADEPELDNADADSEEASEAELELPTGMRNQSEDDSGLVLPRHGKTKKYLARQEELPFDGGHRGRFERSVETIYEGINLDQPTFRRQKLTIRL
jgi:cell division protein FtsZ